MAEYEAGGRQTHSSAGMPARSGTGYPELADILDLKNPGITFRVARKLEATCQPTDDTGKSLIAVFR